MKMVIMLRWAVVAASVVVGVSHVVAQPASTNLIKRIPAGYSLFKEVRGDLNGDGVDDCIFIIRATDKKNIVDEDGESVDLNRRSIMIFFSNGKDYRLVLENRQCFEPEEYATITGFSGPQLFVEVKKGNLYIEYDSKYGGDKYTFRYSNSEFELIGYDNGDYYNYKTVSVNLLTKKKLVKDFGNDAIATIDDFNGCNDCTNKPIETWSKITIKEPITLRNVVDFDKINKSLLDNFTPKER